MFVEFENPLRAVVRLQHRTLMIITLRRGNRSPMYPAKGPSIAYAHKNPEPSNPNSN